MKTAPVVAARVDRDGDATPWSNEFGDVYHPHQGALEQARHVFLAGNGLPGRWRGRERFVVLETGFGLGNNFLATWHAWRQDPQACAHLHFISIELRPLAQADLASLDRDTDVGGLADLLAQAWPPHTCNLHRLTFDAGRVQLLLAFGDVAEWLPQIEASVDAFFLDGFAPARNPQMWEPRLFKAMARIAAPGATAATWTAARQVREGLRASGFVPRLAPGIAGKRDITLAAFAPRFAPRSLPRYVAAGSRGSQSADDPVVVVGAGLAGCALAWALAEQGRRSIVIERRADIAEAGSGNAAGLFHGVVHRYDGHHARFNRAAALDARRAVAIAIRDHAVQGNANGLLRLAPHTQSKAELQATIDAFGLPTDYVRALSQPEASMLAGLPVTAPAWCYPGGGWVDPRGLARAYLERARGFVELRTGLEVKRLARVDQRWGLFDAMQAQVATATTVVLANAGEAAELLGCTTWQLRRTLGQISAVPVSSWPGAELPRLPLAGSGYLLPPVNGLLWFGATSIEAEVGHGVPADGHAANVGRLSGLLVALPKADDTLLVGRAGYRWASNDRLPIAGAVPSAAIDCGRLGLEAARDSPRPDQPRFAPRAPGLFACIALGSRGIAWSGLAAQVVAAAVTGSPAPLEADLLDAIDPARFACREFRRRAAGEAAIRR